MPEPDAPAATRHRRPGWRDPRIALGVVILAASIVGGARLFAAADNTVPVWAAAGDLGADVPLQLGDVVRVRVHFAQQTLAERYLSADQPLPEAMTLSRAIGKGELIPRAALSNGGPVLVRVPLAVAVDYAPADLARGDVVDVWVGEATSSGDVRRNRADLVLTKVVVLSAADTAESLAPAGTRQIIVGVDPAQSATLGKALGQTMSGRVVLTGQE